MSTDLRPYLDREAIDAFDFHQPALDDLSRVEIPNVSYLDTLLLMTISRRLLNMSNPPQNRETEAPEGP